MPDQNEREELAATIQTLEAQFEFIRAMIARDEVKTESLREEISRTRDETSKMSQLKALYKYPPAND